MNIFNIKWKNKAIHYTVTKNNCATGVTFLISPIIINVR